jgi:hypothetical protein
MRTIIRAVENAIQHLEAKAEDEGKHVIKTGSIKERIPNSIVSDWIDQDTETAYLAKCGLAQVVQSRLYEHGYRSLGNGYFVKLDICKNPEYLVELYNNADTSVRDKMAIRKRIKEQCDGQAVAIFAQDGQFVGYEFNKTQEEFYEYVKRDAV